MCTGALFTIAKTRKQLNVHRQIDKECGIYYIYNGISLTHQKE